MENRWIASAILMVLMCIYINIFCFLPSIYIYIYKVVVLTDITCHTVDRGTRYYHFSSASPEEPDPLVLDRFGSNDC